MKYPTGYANSSSFSEKYNDDNQHSFTKEEARSCSYERTQNAYHFHLLNKNTGTGANGRFNI